METINLPLKELYRKLCPKCQEEMVKFVALKLNEDIAKKALEDDKQEERK